jgi:hypothetical protein
MNQNSKVSALINRDVGEAHPTDEIGGCQRLLAIFEPVAAFDRQEPLDGVSEIPDHSAFSRARNERFRDSDILRRVFEHVVETCIAAGPVQPRSLRPLCFASKQQATNGDQVPQWVF